MVRLVLILRSCEYDWVMVGRLHWKRWGRTMVKGVMTKRGGMGSREVEK